jgi:hypothetical protein
MHCERPELKGDPRRQNKQWVLLRDTSTFHFMPVVAAVQAAVCSKSQRSKTVPLRSGNMSLENDLGLRIFRNS